MIIIFLFSGVSYRIKYTAKYINKLLCHRDLEEICVLLKFQTFTHHWPTHRINLLYEFLWSNSQGLFYVYFLDGIGTFTASLWYVLDKPKVISDQFLRLFSPHPDLKLYMFFLLVMFLLYLLEIFLNFFSFTFIYSCFLVSRMFLVIYSLLFFSFFCLKNVSLNHSLIILIAVYYTFQSIQILKYKL